MMLLAPQRRRRFRDPSVLLRMHAGMPLPGGASFARSSPATYFGADGILREAGPDVLRATWRDLDGDEHRETPVTVLEPTCTNALHASVHLPAVVAAWTGGAEFAIAPVASVIRGAVAWQHQNDGAAAARARRQTCGVLTGAPETTSMIVENVTAVTSALGLRDETVGRWVVRGRLTWADGVVSVLDSDGGSAVRVRTELLARSGPNGGAVYRLAVTGTPTNPGNVRRVYVYPTGIDANTHAAILHHVQHEEFPVATSPIVSPQDAAGSRAADRMTRPWTWGLRSMAVYLRIDERGNPHLSGDRRVLQWGSGSVPTLRLVWSGANNSYRAQAFSASGTAVAVSPAGVPGVGDTVELLFLCEVEDGALRLRLMQSVDGGPITDSGWSGTVPADFDPTMFYVGSRDGGNDPSVLAVRDLLVLDGADWTMDAARRLVP